MMCARCDDVALTHPRQVGCDGVVNSNQKYDRCGVCGGGNDCVDCTNVPYGTRKLDAVRDRCCR
jgi:hypothetical protein